VIKSRAMKPFVIRFINLMFGLFLYAFGITVTLRANIGYAPWDAFHAGLSQKAGFSFGTASILVGIFVGVLVMALGEKIGIGTVLNMILIGVYIDIILFTGILPLSQNFVSGIAMLLAGLFTIAVGTYFYIKSGFGAGPRDSLMVVLNRKTKIPVGVCRIMVELTVTFAGWALGGMVGIGTVISGIAIGFFVQLVCSILKFKPASVQHETFRQTYESLKRQGAKKKTR
jgi:uncharacterized membrane protein YczE